MPTFTLYNLEGKEVGTVEQPALFQTPVDTALIHRYLTWVRGMLRPTLGNTKTRGEVSGGGRKPWRQKGTGRARVGSSRSPLWRSGGTVFGPLKEQNWAGRLPRAERRKALFSVLSSKAGAGNVVVVDAWSMEKPKTKEISALLKRFPVMDKKKVLHVHSAYEPSLFLSTRNLPGIDSKTVTSLNINDLLSHDVLFLTKESLQGLADHFTPTV